LRENWHFSLSISYQTGYEISDCFFPDFLSGTISLLIGAMNVSVTRSSWHEGLERNRIYRTSSDPVRLSWYQDFSGATEPVAKVKYLWLNSGSVMVPKNWASQGLSTDVFH